MKRCVREVANMILKKDIHKVRSGELRHPEEYLILHAVRDCERGLLTEKEAIRWMLELDDRSREISWLVEGENAR